MHPGGRTCSAEPLSGQSISLCLVSRTASGALHPGLLVVGSVPCVDHHLADKVATIVSCDTLRGNHPHALWRILRDVCNSQFTHWMQWNCVTDVRAVLGPLQRSLDLLLAASAGDSDVLSDDITMQRVRLPSVLGVAACGRWRTVQRRRLSGLCGASRHA